LKQIGAFQLFIFTHILSENRFTRFGMCSDASGLGGHRVLDQADNGREHDTTNAATCQLADNTVENGIEATARQHREELPEDDTTDATCHRVTRSAKADILHCACDVATNCASDELENDR
jgi:hypothetical protein